MTGSEGIELRKSLTRLQTRALATLATSCDLFSQGRIDSSAATHPDRPYTVLYIKGLEMIRTRNPAANPYYCSGLINLEPLVHVNKTHQNTPFPQPNVPDFDLCIGWLTVLGVQHTCFTVPVERRALFVPLIVSNPQLLT